MSNQHQEPRREQVEMNRRDFLQTAVVTTAATAASSSGAHVSDHQNLPPNLMVGETH